MYQQYGGWFGDPWAVGVVSLSPSADAALPHAARLTTGCRPAPAHVPEVSSAYPPGASGANGGSGEGGGTGGATVREQMHCAAAEHVPVL